MSKKNYKKIIIFVFWLSFILVYSFQSFAIHNIHSSVENHSSDDGILIISRENLKKFVDANGKVLLETNGRFANLEKIYDIETKNLTYLVAKHEKYVDETYRAGYTFYKDVNVKIATIDGIVINEFTEKHFLGDIDISFSYKNYIVYVKKWFEFGEGSFYADKFLTINILDVNSGKTIKMFDERLIGYSSLDEELEGSLGEYSSIHFDFDKTSLYAYIETKNYNHEKDMYDKNGIGVSFTFSDNEVKKVDYKKIQTDDINETSKSIDIKTNPEVINMIELMEKAESIKNPHYKGTIISGGKGYITALNENYENEPLCKYKYNVYDAEANLVLKDLQIANEDTLIHIATDETEMGNIWCYTITGDQNDWNASKIAKVQLNNKYFYAKNKKNNLYDLKTYDGMVIISNIEDYAIQFSTYNDLCIDVYIFKIDNKWFLYQDKIIAFDIDKYFKNWEYIEIENEKYVKVLGSDDKWTLYNENGEVVMKNLVYCESDGNKYFRVENSFYYGLIDKNGEWVVKISAFDMLND